MESVDDGLECGVRAGVGSESVLCPGDEFVFEEEVHDLCVEEAVEDFCDDREEGDRSVVGWDRFVFALYISMTFVIFSASGYLFSWSALLKRLVRSGARKGIRVDRQQC